MGWGKNGDGFSLKVLVGLKTGVLLAAKVIASPVAGFLPVLLSRCLQPKTGRKRRFCCEAWRRKWRNRNLSFKPDQDPDPALCSRTLSRSDCNHSLLQVKNTSARPLYRQVCQGSGHSSHIRLRLCCCIQGPVFPQSF